MNDNLFRDINYRACLFEDSRWDAYAFKASCERQSIKMDIDVYHYINMFYNVLDNNHNYDAIIIDLYHYGTPAGLDFIRYCRNYVDTKHALLIGISGSDTEADKKLALQFGADIFLCKNDIFQITREIKKNIDLKYQNFRKSRLIKESSNILSTTAG